MKDWVFACCLLGVPTLLAVVLRADVQTTHQQLKHVATMVTSRAAKLDEVGRQASANAQLLEAQSALIRDLQQQALNQRLAISKLESQVNHLLGWQAAQNAKLK